MAKKSLSTGKGRLYKLKPLFAVMQTTGKVGAVVHSALMLSSTPPQHTCIYTNALFPCLIVHLD